MVAAPALLGFSLVAFGMVITPGPNMMYLVSRSICQGRNAGLISLAGVASAFIVYMFASALGITALLFAVPFAYDALRFAGAAYLLYMAWQALKPGGRSPFQVRGRIDRGLSRYSAYLAQVAALADGQHAGRTGLAHGT